MIYLKLHDKCRPANKKHLKGEIYVYIIQYSKA
jgi:hypothetical protein